MRKLSLIFALGAVLSLGAIGGLGAAPQARADLPPNVQTVNIYRTSFSPSMMWDPSGVVVTFVNRDSIPHRIVSYVRSSTAWSLDVTLAPGERYTHPEALTCDGGCFTAAYLFRDANLSVVTSSGYCLSLCGWLWVDNNTA
jgi:hypothetical protein